jgi:hypothetical protein
VKNVLAIADVPAHVTVCQWSIGERSYEQSPEKNKKDQISDRWKENTYPQG